MEPPGQGRAAVRVGGARLHRRPPLLRQPHRPGLWLRPTRWWGLDWPSVWRVFPPVCLPPVCLPPVSDNIVPLDQATSWVDPRAPAALGGRTKISKKKADDDSAEYEYCTISFSSTGSLSCTSTSSDTRRQRLIETLECPLCLQLLYKPTTTAWSVACFGAAWVGGRGLLAERLGGEFVGPVCHD